MSSRLIRSSCHVQCWTVEVWSSAVLVVSVFTSASDVTAGRTARTGQTRPAVVPCSARGPGSSSATTTSVSPDPPPALAVTDPLSARTARTNSPARPPSVLLESGGVRPGTASLPSTGVTAPPSARTCQTRWAVAPAPPDCGPAGTGSVWRVSIGVTGSRTARTQRMNWNVVINPLISSS